MALSIKDEETDRLARVLAAATGESITEAIRRALEERLEREKRRGGAYPLEVRVRRVQERLRAFPVLDARSDEKLLGYDAHGRAGRRALTCPARAEALGGDRTGATGHRATSQHFAPIPRVVAAACSTL